MDDEFRFERYRDALIGDLIRNGTPAHDAHDIVQKVMIKTLKQAATIQRGAEWAYLRTAAYRQRINDARQKPGEPLDDTYHDEAPSAEERLIATEAQERFKREFAVVMSEFPPSTQQIIVLRARGLGFDDIAKKLGTTSMAARTRFSRAAQVLRKRLGTPPDGAELPGVDDAN